MRVFRESTGDSAVSYRFFSVLPLLLALSFGLGASASFAEEAPGRAVFEAHKCGLCHGVAAVDIEAKLKSEKMRGPDLSGYVHEDPAWVRAYLNQQETLDGEEHRREIDLSAEEVQKLLDWLGSLEAAGDGGSAMSGR